MLAISLSFSDLITIVIVDMGIFVPGCGGGIVDIPCDVDATFAALETPCGVIIVIAAPEPSAVETLDPERRTLRAHRRSARLHPDLGRRRAHPAAR